MADKKETALARSDQKIVTELASGWHMSDRGREALASALALRKTRHALYAQSPMVCRGALSPCAATCQLFQEGLAPEGERCPIEIVSITNYFNSYSDTLEIDVDNMVDLGLVRELAEVETQLDRIANRLAQEDMIQDVAVGVDRQGNAIMRPEIHKAFEIQQQLRTRKDRILDQLHATRKAKSSTKKDEPIDPSKRAAELMEKAMRLQQQRQEDLVIDVPPEEMGKSS